MLRKLLLLLFYTFYAGLIYTFFTPEHAYLNLLDNTRTFYLLVHIPIQLIMTGILGILLLIQGKFSSEVPELIGKMKADGSLDKFKGEYEKFTSGKTKLLIGLNRLYYVATALIVFIGLGDTFLGVVMLWGVVVGLFLMNAIGSLFKEMNDALS